MGGERRKNRRRKIQHIDLLHIFAAYVIEADNSFGAKIKSEFIVVFYKGKPVHREESSAARLLDPSFRQAMKVAVKMNANVPYEAWEE